MLLRRYRSRSCSPGSPSTRYSPGPTSEPGSGSCSRDAASAPSGSARTPIDSMGPVWEANHVWLIFVLTVFWTSYPRAFGSIASTLAVPLFIAALGIILRGAAYALRAGASGPRESGVIDTIFSVSSVLTPFALGAAIGAIATDRVPVGNASGHLFSSWLNPTSIFIGVVAVANCAYLAAVYLAADAARLGERSPRASVPRRALGAGVVAGAIALGGIVVVNSDYHRLFHSLLTGDALAAVIVSFLAGVTTLALVWTAALRRGAFRRGRRRRGDHRRLGACPLANDPPGSHHQQWGGGTRHARLDRRSGSGWRRDHLPLSGPSVRPHAHGPLRRR